MKNKKDRRFFLLISVRAFKSVKIRGKKRRIKYYSATDAHGQERTFNEKQKRQEVLSFDFSQSF